MTDDLLALAADVARAAGRLVLEHRPTRLQVSSKSTPTDPVTEMDRAAEKLIVDGLLGARPDDGLLGEEGADRTGSSGVRWVIDPIDGTVNYVYGLPAYAVSIAAEVDGRVEVGVVYDTTRAELYSAVRGGGAFCEGERLACSTVTDLDRALIGTGFAYAAAKRAEQAELLVRVLPRVRDIRRGGSSALDLCNVARGRLDGYYEWGLSPWDLAAGGLIAAEAGAVVRGEARGLARAAAPGIIDGLDELICG